MLQENMKQIFNKMLASKQFKRLHFEMTRNIVFKQKSFNRAAPQVANRKLEM